MAAASPRKAQDSYTEMTELVLPQHANALGTAFGGTVLAWMDVCGAIAAQRHCGRVAVTAAMDQVGFVAPIRVGDVVVLSARIAAAFNSSVEVEVTVQVEDKSGALTRCVEAFMTFVAVDGEGKPMAVPPLTLGGEEDRVRVEQATARRRERLARR